MTVFWPSWGEAQAEWTQPFPRRKKRMDEVSCRYRCSLTQLASGDFPGDFPGDFQNKGVGVK